MRNLTDMGNAERLVDGHGPDLRHCAAWGKWLVWDGARWCKDEVREVLERARGVQAWRERGLAEPEAIRVSTAQYRAEEDLTAQFLGDCCVQHPAAMVWAASISAEYGKWCLENRLSPASQKVFGRRLRDIGFEWA